MSYPPKDFFAELKWQTFPERVMSKSKSNVKDSKQDMSRLS